MDFDFTDFLRHLDDVIWVAIAVVSFVARLIREAKKRRAEPAPESPSEVESAPTPAPDVPGSLSPGPPSPAPPEERVATGGAPAPVPAPAATTGAAAEFSAAFRRRVEEETQAVETRARELARQVQAERQNVRFLEPLEGYVPARAEEIRTAARRAASPDPALLGEIEALAIVVDQIAALIAERRDPTLLPLLGDADALADACYAPLVAFARSEGLPLSTAQPATTLGDFDLAIWTGFAPTSIAPIFLPRDFFHTTRWWPALAHEIGHDVLISVPGLDAALRRELRLSPEHVGRRPLVLGPEGLFAHELERIYGGWFEEIFADVFGTLMCGPAYVATMIELFCAPDDPRRVLAVSVDETGRRYDVHPPRHLRVLLSCHVLELAGFADESRRLAAEWEARCGFGAAPGEPEAAAEPPSILFPAGEHYLAVPAEPILAIGRERVARLYDGPLDALRGRGLRAIPGLDYGIHIHQETLRARDAFLGGRVPTVCDVRALVAGAALAALAHPADEARIVLLARRAIPGKDTGEAPFHPVHDASPKATAALEPPVGSAAAGIAATSVTAVAVPVAAASASRVVEAFLLHEILGPPRARRRARR